MSDSADTPVERVPFGKSDAVRRVKMALKRLVGREPRFSLDRKPVLQKRGEWCLQTDRLGPGDIVYSLGVGDDTSFDLALIAEFGVEVHAFDPTPGCAEWLESQPLPESFHFHPWAVAADQGQLQFYPRPRSNPDAPVMYTLVREAAEANSQEPTVTVPAFSLEQCAQKLGHEQIAVLKMDIEGAEYDVLEGLFRSTLRPAQVLVEFHHRFAVFDKQQTVAAVDEFRRLGYRLVDISNTGREFTFLT